MTGAPSDEHGHVEVLPNGQHRWVSTAAPPPQTLPDGTVRLDYGAPAPSRHQWWQSILLFIVGIPGGFIATGGVVTLWSFVSKSSPAMAVLVACVLIILGGGFLRQRKQLGLGWLAFGAGIGMFLGALSVMMFWGWHGS